METAEYREQLNRIEEQLANIYRERRRLTEAYAATHPAELPKPRHQTDRQRLVARCPRCGGRLPEESGLEN